MIKIHELQRIPQLIKQVQKGDLIAQKELQGPLFQLTTEQVNELLDIMDPQYDISNIMTDIQSAADELEYTIHISDHGFNCETYKELLCMLSVDVWHGEENDPAIDSYKLSKVFGNKENAIRYLYHYEKTEKSEHPIHDACLFDIPENDEWKVTHWQRIYSKYLKNPQFRKSFALSKPSEIQKILVKNGKYSIDEKVELLQKLNRLDEVSKKTHLPIDQLMLY